MIPKPGTHRFGKYSVTLAADGRISVKPGDWLSKYSAALYQGDYTRVHEYGRLQGGQVRPVPDVDKIYAGETLYHLPMYNHYHRKIIPPPNPKVIPPRPNPPAITKVPDEYQGTPALKTVWMGVGVQSSGRVLFGLDSMYGSVLNLGDPINHVRYVEILNEGAQIGLGLGGSGGLVAIFAYGLTSPSQFNQASEEWDFGLAIAGRLGTYLKSLKHVTKLKKIGKLISGAAEALGEYKKLKYVGEQLTKSQAFTKPGIFVLPVPGANWGLDLWVGKRAHETRVQSTGHLDFTK